MMTRYQINATEATEIIFSKKSRGWGRDRRDGRGAEAARGAGGVGRAAGSAGVREEGSAW